MLRTQIENSQKTLDAWVREIVAWHFDPATGCPFWLERAKHLDFDPRREIHTYADLARFGFFQDEVLRGGPVRRWVPRGLADKPVYVFETGGSTGVPKSRINIEDFRIDYECSVIRCLTNSSAGVGLVELGADRAAQAPPRRRALGASSRRHLLRR